jgi:hypothetical protein
VQGLGKVRACLAGNGWVSEPGGCGAGTAAGHQCVLGHHWTPPGADGRGEGGARTRRYRSPPGDGGPRLVRRWGRESLAQPGEALRQVQHGSTPGCACTVAIVLQFTWFMLRQGDLASGDPPLTSADGRTTGRFYYGLRRQPTSSAATAVAATMEQHQTEPSGRRGPCRQSRRSRARPTAGRSPRPPRSLPMS